MRPSSALRRFHNERVIANRLAFAQAFDVHADLPAGRWEKRHPSDCGRSRCGVCHGGKVWEGGSRRAKEKRAWQREAP